jgi:serine phosphatase RsbU (regulator of sigma subunit)
MGTDSASEYPPGPTAQLAAGDLLFLYTDGIVEAGSAGSVGQFGIKRALDILRAYREETPDQILDAIYRAARDFSADCDQGDDMTAILVKVDAGNQTPPFLLPETASARGN